MKAKVPVRMVFRFLLLLALGMLAGWWCLHFGAQSPPRIMEVGAVESPLSLRTVLSGQRPFELARWKEIAGVVDSHLDFGAAKMEWSTGGEGLGYLYAWNVHNPSEFVWEFAPCDRSSLNDLSLSDFNTSFHGRDSRDGIEAFGGRWLTNCLSVSDGAIVFARLISDTNSIYALQVAEQTLRSVRIRFRIVEAKAGEHMAKLMPSAFSVIALSTLVLAVVLLQAIGGWAFARAMLADDRARRSQRSLAHCPWFARTRAWLRSGFLYSYLILIFGGHVGASEFLGWSAVWAFVVCSMPLCCIGMAWHLRMFRDPSVQGEDRRFHGFCLGIWLVGLVGSISLLTNIAASSSGA